jgi:hypothetical protein
MTQASLTRALESARTFDPPAEGFDPRQATVDELALHGYPRRPDPEREAGLSALWERTFGKPVRYTRAELEPRYWARCYSGNEPDWKGGSTQAGVTISLHPAALAAGTRMTTIAAEWAVPTTGFADPLRPHEIAMASWIGIGSENHGGSGPALIQAGVQAVVIPITGPLGLPSTMIRYSAFAEWWVSDGGPPAAAHTIPNFAVKPGDTVSFTVCAPVGAASAYIGAHNVSTGQVTSYSLASPRAGLTADGFDAEWKVEGNGDALPEFSTLTFTSCIATDDAHKQYGLDEGGIVEEITNSAGVAATAAEILSDSSLQIDWRNFDQG